MWPCRWTYVVGLNCCALLSMSRIWVVIVSAELSSELFRGLKSTQDKTRKLHLSQPTRLIRRLDST